MSAALVAVIAQVPKLAVMVTTPVEELMEQAVELPASNVTVPPPLPPRYPAVMPVC